MYPFIVCLCGRSLGDIYDLFKMMKLSKYSVLYDDTGVDIDPSLLAISDNMQLELSDEFEELNIHMECCKTRLLGMVSMNELI